MLNKLAGVATLFAAGSILVAGTPALGATSLDTQATATPQGRCPGTGGRRCGGGRCSATPSCAAAPRGASAKP